MLQFLPQHALVFIAHQLLPNKDDLAAFSLVRSEFVRPAREVLFRDCYIVLSEGHRPLSDFVSLVSSESSISVAIHALTLESLDARGYQPYQTGLHQVVALVTPLTVLRSLSLVGLHWMPSPHPLSAPFHPTLRNLTLDNISTTIFRESPLELLRLSDRWVHVNIDELQYGTTPDSDVIGSPCKTATLGVTWCPFWGSFATEVESLSHTFSGLQHLILSNLVDDHATDLKGLLTGFMATVDTLDIAICTGVAGTFFLRR